MKFTNKMECMK